MQTGFLALDDTCVARQEAFPLERDAELGIRLHEGAGDAMAHRSGLAGRTAAVHADAQVVLPFDARHLEGRERECPVSDPREVIVERLAVHPRRSVAWTQDDARHRRLALAGAAVLRQL